MKKFEKLLKKGKIDKNYLYKEIMILKGEKGVADSLPLNTEYDISKSSSIENGFNANFQSGRNKEHYYSQTETDNKGISTFASFDD